MNNTITVLLCLILCAVIVAAGCSSTAGNVLTLHSDPGTRFSSTNLTYANYGFTFSYPDNLKITEYGAEGVKAATWDDGKVRMLNDDGDNISISWTKTYHVPPNIPILYESLWTSLKSDTGISDVKIYNLQTYPVTTCGDATFIGHISFYDKTLQSVTNEGLLMWFNASQDRYYIISIASADDYTGFIRPNLDRYQRSFICVKF